MKRNISQFIGEQKTDQQYSLKKILFLWLLVTLPMGLSRFVILPNLESKITMNPGIAFWLLMILGMMWQFVLSLIVLKLELGKLTKGKLKERLWLNQPISPKTGKFSKKLYWFVIPVILYTFFIESSGLFDFLSEGFLKLFPMLKPPSFVLIQNLATPEFVGAWYIMGIVLISSLFNYLLGEELFFRGVLLPKMNGVFGRWDWAVNGILFATYHVHKIEEVPVFIIGSIFMSYLNKKFRSFYPGLIVHGIEFIPLFVMVLLVVLGVGM